jgi:hypothetical protein
LAALSRLMERFSGIEAVVLDPTADARVEAVVSERPMFRYLPVEGASYDAEKDMAVRASETEFVVFLDGDCRPADDDWLPALLWPFRDRRIAAVAGLTLYDDFSITGKAMSVLDWGYLFVDPGEVVGCYASNNAAFRRSAWLACPPPVDNELRCNCYAHAQALARQGLPMILHPAAVALHELPDIEKERLRRGYDLVGACWINPMLEEARWLGEDERTADLLLEHNQILDEARLAQAPACLKITDDEAPLVRAEMKRLREIDRRGVLQALEDGERTGRNAWARQLYRDASQPAPV